MIIQSFAPLFLLLAIKYSHICTYYRLICDLFAKIKNDSWETIITSIQHPSFGGLVVFIVSIVWLVVTTFVALGFKGIQNDNFISAGEQIVVVERETDGGAVFLVTYVLPLLMDYIDNWRGLLVFFVLLLIVIMLLIHSKCFYNNPMLSLLQYKTYTFKFVNPEKDIKDAEKEYIAITHSEELPEKATIRRKYIMDDVFLIFIEKERRG